MGSMSRDAGVHFRQRVCDSSGITDSLLSKLPRHHSPHLHHHHHHHHHRFRLHRIIMLRSFFHIFNHVVSSRNSINILIITTSSCPPPHHHYHQRQQRHQKAVVTNTAFEISQEPLAPPEDERVLVVCRCWILVRASVHYRKELGNYRGF